MVVRRQGAWPWDSASSRSSAIKSLATEAVPTIWLLPLETSSWVLRSRMATERAAPLPRLRQLPLDTCLYSAEPGALHAAEPGARHRRAWLRRPSKWCPAAARMSCGCGPRNASGSGRTPGLLRHLAGTFASTSASSQPAITNVTAAIAVSTVSGRVRILGSPFLCVKRAGGGLRAIHPGLHA